MMIVLYFMKIQCVNSNFNFNLNDDCFIFHENSMCNLSIQCVLLYLDVKGIWCSNDPSVALE
jgi:hypothetical protein